MSRTLVDSEQRVATVQASIVLVIEIGLVRRPTIQRKREREWEISSEYKEVELSTFPVYICTRDNIEILIAFTNWIQQSSER
jgi:hypothetical protein